MLLKEIFVSFLLILKLECITWSNGEDLYSADIASWFGIFFFFNLCMFDVS